MVLIKKEMLKTGDVLVFKYKGWKGFLGSIETKDFKIGSIFPFVVRLVTLSSYVHTACIQKEQKKFYLIAALKKGVTKYEVPGEWIANSINNNAIALLRKEKINYRYIISR